MESITDMIAETNITASMITPAKGMVFPALRQRYVEGANGLKIALGLVLDSRIGTDSSVANGIFYDTAEETDLVVTCFR